MDYAAEWKAASREIQGKLSPLGDRGHVIPVNCLADILGALPGQNREEIETEIRRRCPITRSVIYENTRLILGNLVLEDGERKPTYAVHSYQSHSYRREFEAVYPEDVTDQFIRQLVKSIMSSDQPGALQRAPRVRQKTVTRPKGKLTPAMHQ